jgi:spore coat protein U-like protein
MRKYVLAPIAAGVLLAVAGGAQAASPVTTTFNVSASVAGNCLVSATDLAFGNYTAVADVTGSSSVKVRCTNGTGYVVKLSSGAGSFAQRTMSDGGVGLLNYNLYTNNTYASIWGDGTASTAVVNGSGSGLSAAGEVNYSVYGKLPNVGNQDAPVGSYLDTITVSVEY